MFAPATDAHGVCKGVPKPPILYTQAMRLSLRFAVACIVFTLSSVPVAFASDDGISRRNGFLLMWQSISRPIFQTRERPFSDVQKGSAGWEELTFAKSRGLLDDTEELFRPEEPLDRATALLWLFRLRNLEPISDTTPKANDIIQPEHVSALALRYGLSDDNGNQYLTQDALLTILRTLDGALAAEEHEVSLYSEKFHGKGTACGEAFDMNALTAAHRSFPCNTLVKVTNVENGKTVTVRINDRGPYVKGRDMDLSLAAFTALEDRSKGKFQARFERLGDALLRSDCTDDLFRRRVGRKVMLTPGIPRTFALGKTLTLKSASFFAVERVVYPDGSTVDFQEWIGPDETYAFSPQAIGTYGFVLRDTAGMRRTIEMAVASCEEQ